jgi:hypothetical protein
VSTPDAPEGPPRPALRVVRGEPSAEELAALVVVLASAGAGGAETPAAPDRSQWAAPDRMMRPSIAPTGWWPSSLPR